MGDSGIILIDMYEVAIRKPRIMLSLISAVKTIFTLGELLIVSRFILDFLHAAPSIFVIWVEALTNPLLRPFVGTFPPVKVGGTFVVEFYEVLALIVYAFLGYILTELLNMLEAHRLLLKREKR